MMLLGQSLIVAWLITRIGKRARLSALGAALLILLPIHDGVSAAMALRGLWGDPSITALQLLALSALGRTPAALTAGWRGPAVIVAMAAALYPMALGFGDFDPYRLGYQPWLMLAVLGLAALVAWWRGQPLYLWLLAVDLLAFAAGLPESTNLWDTLLDPLLAFAALILMLRNGWRTYQEKT
jgi:hypothetical protein